MRIGIDIDGVLNDFHQLKLDYGAKFCYEHQGKGLKMINPDGYEYETFNWDYETIEQFRKEYHDSVTEEARLFAGEVIKKLKEQGHEIYIITARIYTTEESDRGKQMREHVKKWLEENGIYYDKLVFTKEDKVEDCMQNKIDLMIEDKVRNIKNISKRIPVICYYASYNKDCVGDNIIHAYSWYDILLKIEEGKIGTTHSK